MLRIKYIADFKNNEPYLLITSTAAGFLSAASFFRHKYPKVINDTSITEVSEVGGIKNPLSLTPEECVGLADIFERVGGSGKPSHDYFDIKSLPNAEIIVSYGEYDDLIKAHFFMKFVLSLLFLLMGFPAHAEAVVYREIKTLSLKQFFGTIKDWHVTAFQPDGDDAEVGDVSAKLCFWFKENKKQENCTSIISTLPNGGMTYHYQTVKELAIIHKPHLLKFTAEFFGGGSGVLDQLSFWQYDKATNSFSQAGLVTLTEQGEYKLDDQLLITADARWGKDETHFSPHQFDITVYRYVPDSGYSKAFSYLTSKKYPSLDDTNKIDVISHETLEIKKRMINEK